MKQILLSLAVTGLFTACQVENINYSPPIMVTFEPENVQATSASLGGGAIGNGGLRVTEYGIVYNTAGNPTTKDTKIALGENLGEFYNTFDIFEPGKTYSYRTYGINAEGTGYGETYNFTTVSPPPCDHVQENVINTGIYFGNISITDVTLDRTSNLDYNLEFETRSYSSTIRIFLRFKEIGQRLPLSGIYTTVGELDSLTPYSDGKVEMFIWNYGSEIGGATAAPGLKVYVENNNGVVDFIFCDVELNQYYKLNGKFTYAE